MTLFIIVSEKEWETCSIARVSVTCYQWGLMKHLFYRVSKDNKGFHVDSRWSGLPFSEDSCSRKNVISSFIYIFGLVLYINKSSVTTASHLVALLVMQIPKSQWGPTFVDNISQGTMQSTEMFVVYSKLLLITLRIWEAMNVCPVLADSVEISNVSNIVQSRCIKCDWCGLLGIATKSQNYVLLLWCWSYNILYITIKIHKVRYGSIWLLYHVFFVHCCPIWKKQTVKLVLKLRDLASNQYQPLARLDIHALGITAIEILCCSVMGFILGQMSRCNRCIADFLVHSANLLCPSRWDGSPTMSCFWNGLKTTKLQRNGWPTTLQQQERKTGFGTPFPTLFTLSAYQLHPIANLDDL